MTDMKKYIKFVKEICASNQWKKNWSEGGCYIHLEVSEFIEACRGKGDPVDELGDVLFTLLSVADYYGIDFDEAVERNIKKHKKRKMVKPTPPRYDDVFYKGLEYLNSL